MAAPYQMNAADGARARRKAALMRALAGFAAQGPEAGSDFLGSFRAGLAGALNAGVEQRAQEEATRRQALQDQLIQAQIARMTGTQRQEYGAMPWYENPAVDQTLRDQYRADALYHPAGAGSQAQDWTVPTTTPEGDTQQAMFPGLENLPPAGREIAFRQMMEQRYATPQREPQMSAWQVAQIRAWKAQHPGASDADAIAAISYDRPVSTGGMQQLRDYNGPVFRNPQGRLTYEAFSQGVANAPVMVPYERAYGSRYGGDDPGGLR